MYANFAYMQNLHTYANRSMCTDLKFTYHWLQEVLHKCTNPKIDVPDHPKHDPLLIKQVTSQRLTRMKNKWASL